MDGALIVDSSFRTILSANVHLAPDGTTPTSETGMRHQTAERVAKSTEACVIAVSQRRDTTTLFAGDRKHMTSHLHVLLIKSRHGLDTAEFYTTSLRNMYNSFRKRTPDKDSTSSRELIFVIQLLEQLRRKTSELHHYIAELGSEGDTFKSRLNNIIEASEANISGLETICHTVLDRENSLAEEHKASRLAALSDNELANCAILASVLQVEVESNSGSSVDDQMGPPRQIVLNRGRYRYIDLGTVLERVRGGARS